MHSPDDLEKKRFDFLKKLYEVSDGAETKFISMWEIGDQLGFDRELTTSIALYLKGEGLIQFRALGGIKNHLEKQNSYFLYEHRSNHHISILIQYQHLIYCCCACQCILLFYFEPVINTEKK